MFPLSLTGAIVFGVLWSPTQHCEPVKFISKSSAFKEVIVLVKEIDMTLEILIDQQPINVYQDEK